ncbi:uncharacterized protein UV8b_04769 [Ustilaginoidea virens]|uniref:Uncharacterized protein n=1 Tax=Ustilaginoidea virens TaxID=1159556 RepID=A0A8E5HSF3_USTVR|nr:uncharacterized protein UV8b_04769 [Ustilaginoidea virens]QUC20528.1 hypothetical protein UV8b_04769 [Ustilaginoidea virens]
MASPLLLASHGERHGSWNPARLMEPATATYPRQDEAHPNTSAVGAQPNLQGLTTSFFIPLPTAPQLSPPDEGHGGVSIFESLKRQIAVAEARGSGGNDKDMDDCVSDILKGAKATDGAYQLMQDVQVEQAHEAEGVLEPEFSRGYTRALHSPCGKDDPI